MHLTLTYPVQSSGRFFTRGNVRGYCFGFNGQEKDDELHGEGNAYAFEYRIHDARIGRFLSVDPLYRDYPWNSTYAFAENDVISCIDLEGLEKENKTTKAIQAEPLPQFKKISCHVTAISPNIVGKINLSALPFILNAATPLAKDLIRNYAFGNGKTYKLSEQNMKDVIPFPMGIQGVNADQRQRFETTINNLKPGQSTEILWSYASGASQNGTLGNFTVWIWGDITKDSEGNWNFKGVMYFYDFWDFDRRPPGERNDFAEAKVKFASTFLAGTPFHVNSVPIPVTQSSMDEIIEWFKNLPAQKQDNFNGGVQDVTEGE